MKESALFFCAPNKCLQPLILSKKRVGLGAGGTLPVASETEDDHNEARDVSAPVSGYALCVYPRGVKLWARTLT